MFEISQLNLIHQLLSGYEISPQVKRLLKQKYLNVEATVLRAKKLREIEKAGQIVILQDPITEHIEDLAYLFSPFILSNLNQKVIYHTVKNEQSLSILSRYYQANQSNLSFNFDELLDSLGLSIQLNDDEMSQKDSFYLNLINSLCNSKVSRIICITRLDINLELIDLIAHSLHVKIQVISLEQQSEYLDINKINMLQLLFKNKNDDYIHLCTKLSKINAKLLKILDLYSFDQAQLLVDDMFYSEHIFEKLSVYGEYMQTKIQYH
ncbi:hypothetical protein [Acinetobacter sp. SA01]|uniref:hypothetical protein n=1 Tax=Acinetobacter sp. SA01 TaxID=1862567 RepID=UPI00140C6272|nr:hypothetical protein [Acinetobacter sp. SA01]